MTPPTSRHSNIVWDWNETGSERVVDDGHGGDVVCTQTSIQTHSRTVPSDPMTLTPVASSTQEHADKSKEVRYDDTLPHDLLLPHPDDQQRVPLYEKVSDGNKIMTKMANGDRAPTKYEETCPEKIGTKVTNQRTQTETK